MKINELLKQELDQKELSVYRIAQQMNVNYKTLNARIKRNVLTAEELFTICSISKIDIIELYNKFIIDEYLVMSIYDEDTIDQNKFLITARIISKIKTDIIDSQICYVLSTNDEKSYALTKTNYNYSTNKDYVLFEKTKNGLYEITDNVQRTTTATGRQPNDKRTSTATECHPNAKRTSTAPGCHQNEERTSTAPGRHPNAKRTSTAPECHQNEERTSADSDIS